MRELLRQDVAQLLKRLRDVLWFLGEHAFATTLVFVLGATVIATILFWQYVIFAPQEREEEMVSEFEFQQELFEGLLSDLAKEKARVKEADFLNPKDLFSP